MKITEKQLEWVFKPIFFWCKKYPFILAIVIIVAQLLSHVITKNENKLKDFEDEEVK